MWRWRNVTWYNDDKYIQQKKINLHSFFTWLMFRGSINWTVTLCFDFIFCSPRAPFSLVDCCLRDISPPAAAMTEATEVPSSAAAPVDAALLNNSSTDDWSGQCERNVEVCSSINSSSIPAGNQKISTQISLIGFTSAKTQCNNSVLHTCACVYISISKHMWDISNKDIIWYAYDCVVGWRIVHTQLPEPHWCVWFRLGRMLFIIFEILSGFKWVPQNSVASSSICLVSTLYLANSQCCASLLPCLLVCLQVSNHMGSGLELDCVIQKAVQLNLLLIFKWCVSLLTFDKHKLWGHWEKVRKMPLLFSRDPTVPYPRDLGQEKADVIQYRFKKLTENPNFSNTNLVRPQIKLVRLWSEAAKDQSFSCQEDLKRKSNNKITNKHYQLHYVECSQICSPSTAGACS